MVRSFILTLALGLVLLRFELYPVAPGMDAPYYHAMNHAAEAGLDFGTEFVSTYGPFGYLIFTAPMGDLWKGRVFFECLLTLGTALLAIAYVHARFVLAAILLYALALQEAEYRWFAAVVLALLVGLQARGPGAWVALGWAGVLAGFSLLIRVSLGFGSIASVLLGSVLFGGFRRFAVSLSCAVAACVLGWLASGGGVARLPDYLTTGAELASGYSSAVSHAPSDSWRGGLAFAAWLALLTGWMLVQRTARNRVSSVILALPIFIA